MGEVDGGKDDRLRSGRGLWGAGEAGDVLCIRAIDFLDYMYYV